MSHEAFYQAIVPEPCVVLQRELAPFSAGKIVLLHRVGLGERPIETYSESDLATAVLLCGQTFADAVNSLNDPATPRYMRRWRKEVGKIDLKAERAVFQHYIELGSQFPLEYAPKNYTPGATITNLPLVQHVRCTLKHFYHLRDADFWDMPWGLAQWDYYTAPVLNGTGDLVEKSAVTNAQKLADDDFRRANPTLFNADGSMNAAGLKIMGKTTETVTHA